ncbi:Aste57867_5062 [Aphanomyces stellatus]|uniref:Aste57867_5062 protein n=1 Tax=Aphanomyces stellatus TaxID=120398 RepID=A0A485KDV7_9STRA|nr:hypothetical protein As57867_005049 [Aphanomyces stellatus]VFT82143.1 Aste57867_5062 [Aphanomyces stellatus]
MAPKHDVNVRPADSAAATKTAMGPRLRFLRFLDSRPWHYLITAVLLVDFLGNCIVTSVTSTETFYKAAPTTRVVSAGCAILYLIEMIGRMWCLRRAFFRSAACVCDGTALVFLLLALAARFVWSDNYDKAVIREGAWTNKYKLFHEVYTNQQEQYIAAAYCFFVALRIAFKPRARTFSKKLHKYANHDQLSIDLASLRASLRRIPGITAVAIDMMDTDLAMICGREDGNLNREELMEFLQKALHYRPDTLSVDDFLAYLRQVDAKTTTVHVTYGAFDVVKSTFAHWSTQRLDLALTILVVVVYACIVPALAYFLQLLTDEAFPWNIFLDADYHDWDWAQQYDIINVTKKIIYKNELPDEGNHNHLTEGMPIFVPIESLRLGVYGILGVSVPFLVCDYAMGYFQSKMIAQATQRMQDDLLRVLLHQPIGFFFGRTDGDLNNLFQSDIARVNAMWQAVFWNLLQPVVSILIGYGFLLYTQTVLGVMAFSFAIMIVSSGPQGLAGAKSEDFGKKNAYVSAEYQNAISCQKVVRAYGVQAPLLSKFGASIQSLRVAQFGKDFWSGIVQIYIDSAMFVFVAGMTACLSIKVFHGDITPGEFFASVTLLNRVSTPVTVLGGFMRVAIGNASSLQRLDEVLEKDGEGHDDDEKKPTLHAMQKYVGLTHVNFQYTPEKMSLVDVSAVFKQGEYSCIVGPSGCGKSTLLGCLMRLYDVTSGSMTMDGVDVNLHSKRSYRKQTAVVFQQGGVLNGTILDNIRYGLEQATDDDCKRAAQAAECHDFIAQLKDGYETVIGQHAVVNLSGGQLQRICLARALARKPSLLLLDEATSALDSNTEAKIVETLERLARKLNMAVVSVTHRLTTTRNADVIYVMNEGKLIESGKYKELVAKPDSFFAHLIQRIEEEEAQEESVRRSSLTFSQYAVAEDMNSMMDTHRALLVYQQSLSMRSDEDGLSAWQTRKSSTSKRQLSRISRRSMQSLDNDLQTKDESTNGKSDRDSYIVI